MISPEIETLLTRATRQGVYLWVENGELRYRCRRTSVPRDFLVDLRRHREAVREYLTSSPTIDLATQWMPRFRRLPNVVRVASFRHATWNAIKRGLNAVDSTNMHFVVRRHEAPDFDVLAQAFCKLRMRHEVLDATAIEVEGQPWLICHATQNWEIERYDLSHLSQPMRDIAAKKLASELVWRRIDLLAGPLFRAFVISLSDSEHILGFVVHHFISDKLSMGILRKDLARFQLRDPLPDPDDKHSERLQYADYLQGMNDWYSTGPVQRGIASWAAHLAGARSIRRATKDNPTAEVVNAKRCFEIDEKAKVAIASLARQLDTTSFIILLTVQKMVLAKLTGSDQIAFGSVVFGREIPSLMSVVGYFADRIFSRTNLEGDPTFLEAVDRVKESHAEALTKQFFRSDIVLQEIHRQDYLFEAPIFNFAPHNPIKPQGHARVRSEMLRLEPAPTTSTPQPGITYWMTLDETPEGMYGRVNFPNGEIEGLIPSFLLALRKVLTDVRVRQSTLPTV